MKKITHSAIQYGGKIYSLPSPNRHHHVIGLIADSNGVGINGPDIQGFLDSNGHFVNRADALLIALRAGQVLVPANVGNQLYSEDVW